MRSAVRQAQRTADRAALIGIAATFAAAALLLSLDVDQSARRTGPLPPPREVPVTTPTPVTVTGTSPLSPRSDARR